MNRRPVTAVQFLMCCVLIAACTAGNYTPQGKGSSTVIITITGGTNALTAPAIEKATPVVESLRFTVKASDMTTITKEIAFTPPGTAEETFDVPNGTDRVFRVEALDTSGIVVYAGSSTVDLDGNADGLPVEVTIVMAQQFLSGVQMVSSAWRDTGSAITRDSNGNLIIAGSTFGDVDGNLNADRNHRAADVFVSTFGLTGSKLWTRQFGTRQSDIAVGVAVDGSGNIYVAGSTNGNLNGQSNANAVLSIPDAFVVKLDASGNVLWTRLLGSSEVDVATAIAVDAVGNVYITGATFGSLGAFTNAGSGYADIFVAEYDKDGNLLGLDQRGTPYHDSGESVAIDAAGNVYVAGSTYGDLDTNTNAASAAGISPDYCLIHYATGASPLTWQGTTQMGTAHADESGAMAVDSAGNIYIMGSTWGDLYGNTNSSSSGAKPDVFVTKVDVNGVRQWTTQLGTATVDIGRGIAYDPLGYLYVTGITAGSLDANTSAGDTDIFVVKYDINGNKVWTRQIGTVYGDEGSGVVADTYGNVFIVGSVWMSTSTDAVVMSYNMNGVQW